MRLRYLVFILLLIPNTLWAACTGSSPNWSSSGDYDSVSTCVSGATAGDTITVTGNATWASTLTITRGLTLVGSGTPIITASGVAIAWTPNSTAQSNHETLKISGFTIDGTGGSVGNYGLIRAATTATGYVYLIVANNTLKNSTGRAIYSMGSVWGVAYGNTITQCPEAFYFGGNDYYSWSNLTQSLGVAQNFYFEDNTINFTANMTGYSGWTESGQGGRVVVRNNTWDYTNVTATDELWDVHGLQTPDSSCSNKLNNYSTMVAEYYGNQFVNLASRYRWMFHRGGLLLMFYNTISGGANPPNSIYVYNGACNDQACQGSYDQQPTGYYFRNLVGSTEKPFSLGNQGCPTNPRIENTNFWNYNASFNGSAGVGCGTLANRPGTCTTGTAYWATNQSCTNMTGLVGANPSTPISGTLYKCTATDTWEPYYTPYTYPHPLRGVSDTYELSITVVGGGTVNSPQGGIQCTEANSPCTKTCDSGTVLTLTPVANNGWKATPTWSGTGCGTSITMSAARTCTATFAEQYILR